MARSIKLRKQDQDLLQKLRDAAQLAQEMLTEVQDDLEERFESKSEKWQEGEQGEEARELIGNLEDIVDMCIEMEDKLAEVEEYHEE